MDNAFGEGGYAFLNMDASSDGRIIPFEANGVGKILVAYPNLRWDEPGRLDIRQYFSNGHIDPEFQPGENPVQLALNVNGSPVRLLRLFVQPSNGTNKILTLGLIHEDNPRNQDCVVARFTMDGILDPTFNNNGYTVLERPDGPESCEDLILEDQRLIVIGSSPSAGIILFGLNQNGQVDDFFRGHRMSMPRIRSFTWGYDAFVKNYENVPYIILIGGDYNGTRPGTASVIRYHLREQDDGPGNFAVEPPANAAQNRNSGHSYNTLGKSKPKKSPSGKDEKQDSKKKNTGNVLRRLGQ
ncbi:MAG TPA: hypothetical protein DDW49_04000 [Deltaproteobacteria bacterium]|nr:hypothetical protein [Deltaproteobacteria bacterium]